MYWFQSRGRVLKSVPVAMRFSVLLLSVLVFSPIPSYAATADTSSLKQVRRDLSGHYASTNGIQAAVYQPTNARPWVIQTLYADGTPVTIFLDGNAESLLPSGMDTVISIGGSPMRIAARGHRVYAVSGSKVGGLEVYLDDAGRMHTIRGGRLDDGESSEVMEAQMAISKVVDDWSIIRRQVVQLREDGMRVVNGLDAGGVEANQFVRIGDLAPGEAKNFQDMQDAYGAGQERLADFEARLQKAEARN